MSSLELKEQGNTAFNENKYEDAIKLYSDAIKLEKENHIFYSNRSAAYLASDNYDNALIDAEMCLKLKPTWCKGYSRLGSIYFKKGEFEKAKNAYDEGLKIDPMNDALKESLRLVNLELQKKQSNNFMEQMTENSEFKNLMKDQKFIEKMKNAQNNPNEMMKLAMDPEMIKLTTSLMGKNIKGMPPFMPNMPDLSKMSFGQKDEDSDFEVDSE